MEGDPAELTGTSVFNGYLDEEYEEGGRKLPRRRVSNAGVSVRTLTGSSRNIPLVNILENNELVAYIETDENGEFEIPNLPAGRYTVKFDIPGVPMNQQSDIDFELTGEDQEVLEISALIDDGQVSVTRVRYTSNKSALLNDISIYPNPTTGKFRISGTESLSALQIMNSSGKVIDVRSDIDENRNEIEININNYPAGIYFIQLQWKDGVRTMNKIIKH